MNGGVFRTTDTSANRNPHWVSAFDSSDVTCVSMTSLHVSPNNRARVYAGCGASTSSQQGYQFNVRDARPFPGLKAHGYLLLAEAGWESYENSDDVRFSYDRLNAFVGIRKEF